MEPVWNGDRTLKVILVILESGFGGSCFTSEDTNGCKLVRKAHVQDRLLLFVLGHSKLSRPYQE